MEDRQTVIISDLTEGAPRSAISADLRKNTWRSISYETESGIVGNMLVAWPKSEVADITFDLKSDGWYSIYLGMWPGVISECERSKFRVKLTDDKTFIQVHPDKALCEPVRIEEAFWKHADLTGQSLTISHPEGGLPFTSCLAYIKLVPLGDVEVTNIKNDRARTDTRRIAATHDIHGIFAIKNPRTLDAFLEEVEVYRHTDVESLHLEFLGGGDSGTKDYPGRSGWLYGKDKQVFIETDPSETCRLVAESLEFINSSGVDYYGAMIEYAHELGITVFMSLRMNAFVAEPPLDCNFMTDFFVDHPQFRCRHKEGFEIGRMSYAFTEVQDCVIATFKRMADYGCDGVSMLFNRCFPYILYEEPVVRAFMEKTGQDPRKLDDNDTEWLKFRCDWMTGFMRRVRREMDEYARQKGKDKFLISATTLVDEKENTFFAFDVETWMKEGLVDSVIAHSISLAKRNEHSWGDIPIDIDYYARIAGGTSCKLYIDLFPRQMEPEEYRTRAMEVYKKGAYGVSMWDTYSRHTRLRKWSMASRIGHRNELEHWDDGDGTMFKIEPVKILNGLRVDWYNPRWGL